MPSHDQIASSAIDKPLAIARHALRNGEAGMLANLRRLEGEDDPIHRIIHG
jgi:hypothetical protein